MFEIEKIASELANDNLQGFEIERIAKALNGDGQGFEIERIAESVKGGGGDTGDKTDINEFIEGKFTYIENNASIIRTHCFYQCNLTSVSFPECTSVQGYGFIYCSSLTTVNFPKCTIVGVSAFNSCESLTSASFPKCREIKSNAFAYCDSLENVSFPECVSIDDFAFCGCSSLKSLYLLGSSIASLKGNNAFASTNASLAVYVPQSLYSGYTTASNWTNMSSRIVSLTTDQIAAL